MTARVGTAIILAAEAPAATNHPGNQMLDDLRLSASAHELNAHRYIQVVVDMEVLERGGDKRRPHSHKYACMSSEVTVGQVLDLGRLQLEQNPAARHHGAFFFLRWALLKAFPRVDNPR